MPVRTAAAPAGASLALDNVGTPKLRVRDNHQGLHACLQDTFALKPAGGFADYAHDYADTVGKDHGRIETRRCWTTGDPALRAHADPDRKWCDLASLVWVESERHCRDQVPWQTESLSTVIPT